MANSNRSRFSYATEADRLIVGSDDDLIQYALWIAFKHHNSMRKREIKRITERKLLQHEALAEKILTLRRTRHETLARNVSDGNSRREPKRDGLPDAVGGLPSRSKS